MADGAAVKVQLAAIKLGSLIDLAACYIIGFEIYNNQALRRANQHINYDLNNYSFIFPFFNRGFHGFYGFCGGK